MERRLSSSLRYPLPVFPHDVRFLTGAAGKPTFQAVPCSSRPSRENGSNQPCQNRRAQDLCDAWRCIYALRQQMFRDIVAKNKRRLR